LPETSDTAQREEDTLGHEEEEEGTLVRNTPTELEEPRTPRTRPLEGNAEDFRTPTRRRVTKLWGSPKRELQEAEMFDIEEARSKILCVSSITSLGNMSQTFVSAVDLKDGTSIPVDVNIDPSEQELELIAKEPLLWYEPEFQKELLIKGMKKEMQSIKDFDVYEEELAEKLTPEELKTCIPTKWVHKAKGLEVKSRVVVKGYKELVEDKDETYARTPSFTTLKLLLTLALAKHWFGLGADVSTAVLHATWTKGTTYVWPPEEFYPAGGVVWKLKKAL
jgi:hypothetical protein